MSKIIAIALLLCIGINSKAQDFTYFNQTYGGNDTIYGYGGNDSLYGAAGLDYLYGYDHDDYLDGGSGAGLSPGMVLAEGWGRLQGIVFRPGDPLFEGRSAAEAVAAAVVLPVHTCRVEKIDAELKRAVHYFKTVCVSRVRPEIHRTKAKFAYF